MNAHPQATAALGFAKAARAFPGFHAEGRAHIPRTAHQAARFAPRLAAAGQSPALLVWMRERNALLNRIAAQSLPARPSPENAFPALRKALHAAGILNAARLHALSRRTAQGNAEPRALRCPAGFQETPVFQAFPAAHQRLRHLSFVATTSTRFLRRHLLKAQAHAGAASRLQWHAMQAEGAFHAAAQGSHAIRRHRATARHSASRLRAQPTQPTSSWDGRKSAGRHLRQTPQRAAPGAPRS